MLLTRRSIHASPEAMDERQKSTMEFAIGRGLVRGGQRELTQMSQRNNCSEGLFRSSCTPLVPVVKSADLRYRNHGTEFPAGARAAVPACPWPARGASGIRDNTSETISRADTARLRSRRSHDPDTHGEECQSRVPSMLVAKGIGAPTEPP